MKMEDIKELVKMADMVNGKKMEENKGKILEGVKEQLKGCKRVFISVSENGCIISGSGINVLGGISLLAHNLKEQSNLDDDMILEAVKIGLQGDNKEEKYELKEMLEKFKEIMED